MEDGFPVLSDAFRPHRRSGAGETFKRRSILCAALVLLSLAARSHGVPAFGELFALRQPDGSTIQVRIWGDEFYQVVESLDGYTLVRDPLTREICYARLSADGGELISTGISAGTHLPGSVSIRPHLRLSALAARARSRTVRERRSAKRMAVSSLTTAAGTTALPSGDIRGICVIVDFPDRPGTIAPAEISDFCNQIGYRGYGNNGSVRDYFYDVSGGRLTYSNYVPARYYTAPKSVSYYDDCSADSGERIEELLDGALAWLEREGFDFSQYDSDGDGHIDAVSCFFAGRTECGWLEGLWPQQGWYYGFSADGVRSRKYQICGMGDELRLRTFCHETGHLLCDWPDLYDRDQDSHGVGRYCLMGSWYTSDATNPFEPCAYLKYLSNWATVTVLSTPQTGLSLTAGTNTIFKLPHPELSNEFFLISNRQRSGRDIRLPDSGLAIWHIDEASNNDNQQMTPELHYKVALIQADGRYDLEERQNLGDATDLFGSPFTEWTPFSEPGTRWWAGNKSAFSISNISPSGATMWFDFAVVASPPSAVSDAITVLSSESSTIRLQGLDDYLPDPPAALTYTITSLPRHGTLAGSGQSVIEQAGQALAGPGSTVVYTPHAGYLGADSFRFKVSDGGTPPSGGDSPEATISIEVSRPVYVDDDAPGDPRPGDPARSDPREDGSSEHPFDSIQEAIDQAISTETIIIRPGTYTGAGNRDIDFGGKPVKVRGQGGPEGCLIDCQDLGRGFYFHRGEGPDSVLEGLTIANGFADRGGGIYCTNGSSPTLTRCTLRHNEAQWGGGMRCLESSPTVEGFLFIENTATNTGGGMQNYKSSPHISHCTFTGNVANYGGGMQNHTQSNATLSHCTFKTNHASECGGGVENELCEPVIADCTFRFNTAQWGGGLRNYESHPTVSRCIFVENSATEQGGGIQNNRSHARIEAGEFSKNTAERGGGVRNYESDPTVVNCTFDGNVASDSGGAIESYLSNPTLICCVFRENSARWGGGLCVYGGCSVPVTNCTLVANSASSNGGGICVDEGSSLALSNSILWANAGQASQIVLHSPGSSVTISNSDIEGGWNGAGVRSWNGASPVTNYGWNINLDPDFVNEAEGDLRLSADSPCIDTGDNAAAADIPIDADGNPRIVAGGKPRAGTRVDMGAYEFQGH